MNGPLAEFHAGLDEFEVLQPKPHFAGRTHIESLVQVKKMFSVRAMDSQTWQTAFRSLHRLLGMTQAEICARHLGVPQSYYSRWTSGAMPRPEAQLRYVRAALALLTQKIDAERKREAPARALKDRLAERRAGSIASSTGLSASEEKDELVKTSTA